MGHRFPHHFPTALALFLVVLAGAIYSIKNGRSTVQKLNDKDSTNFSAPIDSFFLDLESNNYLENLTTLQDEGAFSGMKCCVLNGKTEYSVTFTEEVAKISDFDKHEVVHFSFSIFATRPLKGGRIVYSLTNEKGKDSDYQSDQIVCNVGSWVQVRTVFKLSDEFREGKGKVKIYIWNKDFEEFKIDDLIVKFR